MRDYELIYIVKPDVAEEQLPGTVEKVSKLITDKGGAVEKVDPWGRKKLAYPIQRFSEGSYFSTRFKFNPLQSRDLDNSLKLTEEIIRYLLIRVGD